MIQFADCCARHPRHCLSNYIPNKFILELDFPSLHIHFLTGTDILSRVPILPSKMQIPLASSAAVTKYDRSVVLDSQRSNFSWLRYWDCCHSSHMLVPPPPSHSTRSTQL